MNLIDKSGCEAVVTDLLKTIEPEILEENLSDMYLSWVKYQESPTHEYREDITSSYVVMRDHLRNLKELALRQAQCPNRK
jgi:hypothetical protein